MNGKMMKRALSLLLMLAMLMGNVPTAVFAADGETSAPKEAVVEETAAATEPVVVEETVAATEPAAVEETSAPPMAATEETEPAMEDAQGEEHDHDTIVAEYQTVTPDPGLPDNQELHTAYAMWVLYGEQYAQLSTAAGKRLTGDEKVLYDALVPILKQIASGERASSIIGVGQTVTYGGETYKADVEATFAGASFPSDSMNRVIGALLSDLPFEMYWYDKTIGCGYMTLSGGTIAHMQLRFYVAGNYQGTNEFEVDTGKTGAASAAVSRAKDIVSKYAGNSDYEKLVGYRDEICKLVTYDFDAAYTGNFSLNDDPWQLISVFDGDATTNVVCEGYSKAFMYLCDLSAFAGDTACYTVTGELSGGGHMWNIVTMDGGNYMADVTNSDTGTVGQNGGLFLVGGSGNPTNGYTFLGCKFTYDSDTTEMWGTGSDSILWLSEQDYKPAAQGSKEIASGTCGENVTWVLTDDGVLTISGTGAMADYDWAEAPWWDYQKSITSAVMESGVTSIGNYAFGGCDSLTSIAIPEGVTSIGDGAFECCESLTSITLPESVTSIGEWAFSHCDSLTSIAIPEGVTSIGNYAFWYCGSLSSITLPDSVTSIGDVAFCNCYSLSSITIPEGVTSIGNSAFSHCYSLTSIAMPESVTSIGEAAFRSCESLTSITLPESVTSIDSSAFEFCSSLSSITIPESVTSIGDAAFGYCDSLTSITLPESVTSIGSGAFYFCSSLTSINIPDSVTSIGDGAFMYCESLIEITFKGNAPAIGEWAFDGVTATAYYPAGNATWTSDVMQNYGGTITWKAAAEDAPGSIIASGTCGENVTWVLTDDGVLTISGTGAMADYDWAEAPWWDYQKSITSAVMESGVTSIGDGAFLYCRSLSSITLPEGVTSIGEWAFTYCYSLRSITIPEGVTSIGDYAFSDCSSLSSITIPESVTSIGNYAFNDCDSLTSIAIPESVTSIGDGAFSYCDSLTSIAIPESVTSIGDDAFSYCYSLKGIWVSEANPNYSSDEFGVFFNKKKSTLIQCPGGMVGTYRIPDSVTSIGNDAFEGCVSLTNVTIPDSVTSIGDGAFSYCSSLTSITIPEGVTSIGYSAFFYCESLTSITIPESVTSIGGGAFEYCESLIEITFKGNAPAIGEEAFSGVTATAYYPAGNATWTSDVMQNYGGSLTWVAVAHEHEWGEWVVTKEPTCTEKGEETRTCSVCGESETRDVKALDHDLQHHDAKDATCTEIGWDAYDTCSRCDYTTYEEIPAMGHNYESVVTDPTCTEQGYTTHTCTRCGDSFVDTYTDPTGHSFGEWIVTTEPTCTEKGEGTRTCSTCGHTETREMEALGHSFGDWIATTEPTCTEKGEETRTCSVCGETETREVAALGHDYNSVVTEPTYTKKGYTTHTCTRCGDSYVDSYVDALGLPTPAVQVTADVVTGGATLSWEHDGEADFYEVYYATSRTGKYKLLDTADDAQFQVTPSVGKTYYYKVKAVCEADASLSSSFSAAVKATGKCAQPELTVEVNEGSGKPVLSWGKISGAKKYEVYRATAEDGTYKKVKTTTSRTYTDTSAAVGTTYYYKVKAVASSSTYNSVFSEIKFCQAICARPVVTASIDAATGRPILSWKAVTGAVGYEISRAESEDGELEKLATETALTYTDEGAAPDTDYWYAVKAIGSEPELSSTNSTAVKIHSTLAKPVVAFAVDAVSGKPVLTWEEVDGAKEYIVYRSTSATKSYKAVTTTTELEFTDTTVSVGKGYYYKVIAIGENAKSAYSSYKKLSAKCAQPELNVEVNTASGKPMLTWGKISGAKKYEVYRAADENGTYKKIKTVTTASYTDTSAVVGTPYFYKIRAVASSSSYNSIFSEIKFCQAICARPVVTVSVAAATGKPVISWKAVTGAASYEIYRSENDGEMELVTTQTELTYTDEEAIVDSQYSYVVKALAENHALDSAESVTVSITAACAKPVATIALNGNKPMISWEPVAGAVKYEVYRSTKASSGYKKVATVEEGESYTDLTAKKGTTYYYKVVAVSESTSSAFSNYVKIKSK